MSIKIAKYKCMKCGFLYEGKSGPTQCPKCNSYYVEWINYWSDFSKEKGVN